MSLVIHAFMPISGRYKNAVHKFLLEIIFNLTHFQVLGNLSVGLLINNYIQCTFHIISIKTNKSQNNERKLKLIRHDDIIYLFKICRINMRAN